MDALEVGVTRIVAGVDEGLEASLHEVGHAAADDVLLAEEVGLGLGAEVGLEKGRAGSADGRAVGEGDVEGVAGGVLVGADEAGRALAGEVLGAHGVTGGLGGDHDDVDVLGRHDAAVVDVEAVSEGDGLTGGEVRLDVLLVHLGLKLVVDEDHDDVCPLGGLRVGDDLETLSLGLGLGLGALVETDLDVDAGVLEVQRVRVTLGAVADDGDLLAVKLGNVTVGLVIHLESHVEHLSLIAGSRTIPPPPVKSLTERQAVTYSPRCAS